MEIPITVVIPVGPHLSNFRWFDECIESVQSQSVRPSEILVIDDQADIGHFDNIRVWETPWLSGVAHSFNFGVALAKNELVIMLGSDDRLLPKCIEKCWDVWQREKNYVGCYYLGVEYSTGEIQNTPCNAIMVPSTLWSLTGGFPIESSVGMCDNMLFQIMAQHKVGKLYQVSDESLYWYRNHEETDTRTRPLRQRNICSQLKTIVSDNWEKPKWTPTKF